VGYVGTWVTWVRGFVGTTIPLAIIFLSNLQRYFYVKLRLLLLSGTSDILGLHSVDSKFH